MTHFKIIGWFWLVFGVCGLIYSAGQFAAMAPLIFLPGAQGALIPVILGCVFTLASALAGFGLLRHWRWPRIAVEILGGILFAFSVIFLFADFIAIYAVFAAIALYSLVVALFVRYEPPPTALDPTATAPSAVAPKLWHDK